MKKYKWKIVDSLGETIDTLELPGTYLSTKTAAQMYADSMYSWDHPKIKLTK